MLQDVIKAATELKSKQLKARPGRQAWEQAPDFMKLTATRDEAITALRCSPFAQRMEAAHELREQGSKLARDADQEGINLLVVVRYGTGAGRHPPSGHPAVHPCLEYLSVV
mmetsp:Transcript_13923/g.37642  ORF Transcript_13923/g.37642 Transcript_13923/m.37642 type:complete len:111 (-) Transcript_13923:1048-1380(-)